MENWLGMIEAEKSWMFKFMVISGFFCQLLGCFFHITHNLLGHKCLCPNRLWMYVWMRIYVWLCMYEWEFIWICIVYKQHIHTCKPTIGLFLFLNYNFPNSHKTFYTLIWLLWILQSYLQMCNQKTSSFCLFYSERKLRKIFHII